MLFQVNKSNLGMQQTETRPGKRMTYTVAFVEITPLTKGLLRSPVFTFVQLWCSLSLIFSNAFVDSGKKDDDRLVKCSKCHKPYKSLPRLRNHTVKCNSNHTERDHLEQNCNNEPASVQTKISTVIQTNVNIL